MDKAAIVEVLEEIAELLELKGENAFKVRAYQNGARALETLDEDLGTVIAEERLGEVKGIGKALVEKITTLHETGELEYYDKLRASVPDSMIQLLEIPSLGPKKIKKLHDALGVESIEQLAEACRAGKVAELEGFGEKTQEKLLAGIANREAYAARHRWADAEAVAAPILDGLRKLKQVKQVEAAGSLRRKRETVGDLDFLVASDEPEPVMAWFTGQDGVAEVTAHGETKSSVRLESGLQADLRVVPPAQFFYALHHFTGSKEHNVRMRQRALEQGLSLSEWGLFPEDTRGGKENPQKPSERSPEPIDGEKELFKKLGLAYIPPELREDRGEIEAAEKDKLPALVEPDDIRGVFHNHTTASDGRASLEEMVQAAQDLGFEYLGIADHSKSSFQANGLDEDRLAAQVEAIATLNASKKFKTWVFTGSEVDILSDGRLDFSDEILKTLDCVVASIHAGMTNDEKTMTKRLVKALENEHVTMLGHMTGRLLLRREGYPVDTAKVIDAALANGKIIELNANPWRLDMDWRLWHKAAERGLLCSINPDAHAMDQLEFFRNGVDAARKGWLEPRHILNTRPLKDVKKYLGVK
ncbi:MAG: DNA polymerase/3'-5' exonuclease PolX [Verrucomicrobiota bacterium JB024]|nr:DNA polymerase/3'-5' exonuclease PolX [Verrucomicrobiota bacterium JB024]